MVKQSQPPTRPLRAAAVVSLVPSPEVDCLRCHTAASGFRNVYVSGRYYVAKVKEGGVLRTIPGSRSAQAHQCALHVVAWYKARFGRGWEWAIRRRKAPYWNATYDPELNGFVLSCWLSGSETVVTGGDGNPRVFDSETLARAWLKWRLFGKGRRRSRVAAWRA